MTPFLRCFSAASVISVSVVLAVQPSFDYDRTLPVDVQETSRREKDGALLRDVSYATLDGRRNGATLVTPAAGALRSIRRASEGPAAGGFLLGEPKLEGEARKAFVDRLTPLDPIAALHKLTDTPLLFQFATDDRYVPKATADALVAAAPGKPEVRTYKAGHELNEEATRERTALAVRLVQRRYREAVVVSLLGCGFGSGLRGSFSSRLAV